MNGRGVLIGTDDGYYFGENLDSTAEALGVRVEGATFSDSFDSAERDYLCEKRKIPYVLDRAGESITLCGTLHITYKTDSVVIEGNGIKTEIFMKDYLQNKSDCDIILNNYGAFLIEEAPHYEYKTLSLDARGFYITVNEKGEVSFGGSEFG